MSATFERVLTFLAVVSILSFTAGLHDVRLLPLEGGQTGFEVLPEVQRGQGQLLVSTFSDQGVLAGAKVRVFWRQGSNYFLAGEGSSDSEGRWLGRNLPLGVYWVLVDAPGHARFSTQVVLDDDPRELRLRIPKAHHLRVRIEDDQGEPLVGATVLVLGHDPLPHGALTGAGGIAHLTRLGDTPWTVKASAEGYESITRSGVSGDLTLTLRRLSILTVRVVGPKGTPAAGADVLIGGAALWPARITKTSERGDVRIAGLLEGRYDLKAVRGNQVSITLFGFQLPRGGDESVTLVLEEGSTITALVTDGAGDSPLVVQNADVALVEDGISSFPIRGRTGTDGTVQLGPIPKGRAFLAARADDFVARAAVPVPDPLEGPVRISLMRGGTLIGEVVDERGYPIDGASIEVIGSDLEGLPIAETPTTLAFRRSHFQWSLSGPIPLVPVGELGVVPGPVPPIPMAWASSGTAGAELPEEFDIDPWVTDGRGEFRAHPITPGRLRALVRHPAYVDGISDLISLGPGEVAKVKVVLLPGGSLEGRVSDHRGFPVAGARVDLTTAQGTLDRGTLTAEDGTFAFAAVPAEAELGLARPEDLSRIVKKVRVQVKPESRTEVDIDLPEPRGPVRFLIHDPEDVPIDAAQLTVMSLTADVPLRLTLFTGSDGIAELSDALGLPLRLLVEVPGRARLATVIPSAEALHALELTHGVIVEGEVTASHGRQQVSSASVTFVTANGRRSVLTDAHGKYRLTDISPGLARVLVQHPDYAPAEASVDIVVTTRPDRPFEVDAFELLAPGSVSGKVVDAEGKPVLGARVAIDVAPAFLPVGSLPPGIASTDSDGKFTLAGLTPGKLYLDAYAAGVGRGGIEDVEVKSGSTTTDIVIQLTEPIREEASPASGGVAVTLGERQYLDGKAVVVVHVADASEAERAGLRQGDVLLTIDDKDVERLSDARLWLSGPAGSSATLDIARGEDDGERQTLSIVREPVRH